MGRLTYKSSWGDYGSAVDWADEREEIMALRNKLGKYEDNEWVSVAKHGNPKANGMYEVTLIYCGKRRVDADYYNTEYGFLFDECNAHVVAWRNLPEPYEGGLIMFVAWRMQDFESAIDVCERRNTCYDCDNERCWRHGDKGADCPKYRCDNINVYDCDNCEFIDEYIEAERNWYKSDC